MLQGCGRSGNKSKRVRKLAQACSAALGLLCAILPLLSSALLMYATTQDELTDFQARISRECDLVPMKCGLTSGRRTPSPKQGHQSSVRTVSECHFGYLFVVNK